LVDWILSSSKPPPHFYVPSMFPWIPSCIRYVGLPLLPFWLSCCCAKANGSCAGWGILGACEEQTDHELRSQFETNVYGTFNVIRHTLPILRNREGAKFINLTSTSIPPLPHSYPYPHFPVPIPSLLHMLPKSQVGACF